MSSYKKCYNADIIKMYNYYLKQFSVW